MYYENIFKEKRTADYNVYTFSLFSTKFATHEPPPPPTPTPSKTIYYVCVVHFSQKQSILHVYVCFAFQSQEQSSPALTQCVRKDLAMAVRDLMQHGLMEVRFISTPHTPPTPTPTPHPHTFITCMFITVLSILTRIMEVRFVIWYLYPPSSVCKSNHLHVYCDCYQY